MRQAGGAFVLGAQVLPQEALATLEGSDFQPNIWLGLESDGTLRIVAHRSVFPPIGSTFAVGTEHGSAGEIEIEMDMCFSDVPYGSANHRVENGQAPAHVRIGWMRSAPNIYHAFAICSFADELAHNADKDPLKDLLDLIGEPREIDSKAQGVDYPNMGGLLED